jgi:Putative zincin peptidase
MRLHFGPVPENPDFHPQDEGWTPLREPSAGVFVLLASGVGVAVGVLVAMLWAATVESGIILQVKFSGRGVSTAIPIAIAIAKVLGAIALLIVVHELLHAAVYPGGWLSRRTIIGMWLSKGMFYAHYDGPLRRNRILLVSLTPFLVLTVGLWLAELVLRTGWGTLPALSVLNAIFAGGDILATGMVVWQLPSRAEVRNQGWNTWWRLPPRDGDSSPHA